MGTNSATIAIPSNMSLLFDASCGKGELAKTYPRPLTISTSTSNNLSTNTSTSSIATINIPCGYAGGIGPSTIHTVLDTLKDTCQGTRIWIDMESNIRTKVIDNTVTKDIFDIHKCFQCVLIGIQFGLPVSKFSLCSI